MRTTLIALALAGALVGTAMPAAAEALAVGPLYVDPAPTQAGFNVLGYAQEVTIWQETNGVDGLQKCPGRDATGRAFAADDQLFGEERYCI